MTAATHTSAITSISLMFCPDVVVNPWSNWWMTMRTWITNGTSATGHRHTAIAIATTSRRSTACHCPARKW